VNSGRAGAYEITKLRNITPDAAGSILALWFGIGHHQGSDARVVVKASSEDHAIAEMTGCALKGSCPEICTCWCIYISYGGNDINTDFQIELIRGIPWGDEDCCFEITRKGTKPEKNPKTLIAIPEVSPELISFLKHAYLGEMWAHVTRAFIDAIEGVRTSEILCAGMKSSGLSWGEKIMSIDGLVEKGPGELVHWLNSLHKKVERCSLNEDFSMGEVTDCPFSDAPKEICSQYQSFYNGILEYIYPDYEFSYDRMMTKGDSTCHWTIKMKLEPVESQEQGIIKESSETPLELLKKRFVKGEITPEQYRQYRDILLEK
jgi:hypothetical protein